MTDTETREIIAMMLKILEQENGMLKSEFEPMQQELACQVEMSQKFVYSRRRKYLRELEAQHEATVVESATDDQKLRMHSVRHPPRPPAL